MKGNKVISVRWGFTKPWPRTREMGEQKRTEKEAGSGRKRYSQPGKENVYLQAFRHIVPAHSIHSKGYGTKHNGGREGSRKKSGLSLIRSKSRRIYEEIC